MHAVNLSRLLELILSSFRNLLMRLWCVDATAMNLVMTLNVVVNPNVI